MTSGVRIDGLRETVRNLERLGVDVEDLKDAFGAISRDVAHESQAIVTVDTGALQGTIRPARTKNKAVVRAGTAGIPYAGVINYGWPDHGIEPTEFLTGPANANLPERVQAIEKNLRDLIDKRGLG